MLSKMGYGLHFWKYPKDKTFLFQMQIYINRIINQRKTKKMVQNLQKSDQNKKVTVKNLITSQ